MSKKRLFKKRERNGVRKFWYIFIMALLSIIYLCGQQLCEWERLTETFATVIAIITIVAFWLEYNENKLLNEAQFITDLNEQFIGNDIERYGKKYIINRNSYLYPALILREHTDKTYEELSNDPDYKELLKSILTECNRELRNTMATRTFEIWEDHARKHGVETRADIPADYWDQFIMGLTKEWPGYKMSDNVEQRFHTKAEIEQDNIRTDLANIRPTMQNAFLFNKRLK